MIVPLGSEKVDSAPKFLVLMFEVPLLLDGKSHLILGFDFSVLLSSIFLACLVKGCTWFGIESDIEEDN